MDLVITVPLFILTLPVQAATALAVRLRLGSPVFFRQLRPGLHGEPFVMMKFRTMLPVDVAAGRVDDASRMTSLGRGLRATSVDELPTLWNIIRGDMSLVGPRPLLMQYLERYSSEQARRHDVRPGLTGLAQISGRNALSWDDKFRLDVEYVDHHSLFGDLQIMLATVRSVVRRDGISAAGEVTMPEFMGNTGEGSSAGGSSAGGSSAGGSTAEGSSAGGSSVEGSSAGGGPDRTDPLGAVRSRDVRSGDPDPRDPDRRDIA